MELTFLGTAAGMPSKERNVSAIMLNLLHEINELWLFDCGEATQHKILRTTLKPRKITNIFITHLHGDHIFGLPGLLSSRSFLDGEEPVTIYGPPGIKKFVATSLSVSRTHLTYPIHYVEIEQEGKILENERFIVETKKLDHNITSFGFRITEKDQIGELLVDKLISMGIKPGPIYRKIKEQEKTVLEDGTVIYRKDVVGPPKKGKVITIFGDTKYNENFIPFIKGSDVLVHEATFDHSKKDLAKQYHHATAHEAATLAKKASVKQLILTHISSRYQLTVKDTLLKEATDVFDNTKIAYDLFTYKIK